MVDFEYWFDNVVSCCDLVLSTVPDRVWIRGEKGLTSAYDPAEFFEQTLGDSDSQNLVRQFAYDLRTRGAYEAVLGFSVP